MSDKIVELCQSQIDEMISRAKEDAVSEFIKLADSIRFAKKLRGISCYWWEAMMEAQEKMREKNNE